MNTFEQLIGSQITKFLRLDTGEDFPPLSFPLAIFLMLDEISGLFVGFGFHNETITLSYLTLEDLKEEYGTEWGETSLNEIEPFDKLNNLVGQTLKSIKVGQLNQDNLMSDSFIIKSGQYAGVIIETDNQKLTIFSTKEGGQILFNSDTLFPNTQSWGLT